MATKTLPPIELKSVVNVQTYADGRADITVRGDEGTLTLTVFSNSTVMGIKDPTRGHHDTKTAFSLSANGHLRGWFVEKKGATAADDTLVWFPARKPRAKKSRKKATASRVRHE